MKKSNFYLSAALAAAVLVGPMAASAATLYGSTDASGAVNVAVPVSTTVKTVTNSVTNTTSNVGADVNTNVSGNVNDSTSANAGVNVDTSAAANLGTTDSNGVLSFDRSNTNSDKADASSVVSVRSADTVATNADLKSFAAGNFQNDTNLQDMSFAQDKVSVGYNEHGHLFGFIPVTMNVTTDVDANGNVSTHYPWYNFFVGSDRADLEASLKANVSSAFVSRSSANASLSAQDQARIAAAVYQIMHDKLQSDTNASATTNASASSTSGY